MPYIEEEVPTRHSQVDLLIRFLSLISLHFNCVECTLYDPVASTSELVAFQDQGNHIFLCVQYSGHCACAGQLQNYTAITTRSPTNSTTQP